MIWLIGNRGMLGQEVARLLEERNINYWGSSSEINIADYKILEKFGRNKKIVWLINCAGYTKVDKAEEEADRAFRINRDGVRNIALFAAKRNLRVIHISTDYVFDGQQEGKWIAYKEDDKTNPLNIYGKSKLAGENEMKKIVNHYFIIRTSWLYGRGGENFVSILLKLLQERSEIKIVSDQWGSPTNTADLAEVILRFITGDSHQFGIYNFTNEGITNWYEFAKVIYKKSKYFNLIDSHREVEIRAIKTEEYPALAQRPKWSVLSKEKIKKELNIEIRNWQDALADFLTLLKLQKEKV